MSNIIEKKRGALLTTWLILILIFNAGLALLFLITVSVIPTEVTWDWGFITQAVLIFLNIVFVGFLFKWKKWAFWAFCGSTLITVAIDLIFKVGIYSLLILLIPIVLYLLLRPKWDLLE